MPDPAAACPAPLVSVVIPMFNEGENVRRTLEAVAAEFRADGRPERGLELVCVDDGSADDTAAQLERLAAEGFPLRVVRHAVNRGRGSALRSGFAAARGDYLVAIDADLSYHPAQILELIARLEQPDRPDIVMASPYMPGGRTEGVDPFRLLVSRSANILLRQAMGRRYHTLTGIFRAYRREVFDCLELYSDSKDIHLEIVAKAEAAGLRIVEVPAVLTSRKLGKSKLKLRMTTLSHLMFSFYERPLLLFGAVGLAFTLLALLLGAYLFYLYLTGTLNPTRPIALLSVLLLLAGIQMAGFAFISTQIALLKRELFRTQKAVLQGRRARRQDQGPPCPPPC